ncbi:hypothetical protein IMX26_16960 [Clostridium sp. 'deep sea']|uniref:hypothetical protein n=1 Tax=Clostridium sp. 'deep sea' TaxID=2779445 RepID=UPI00189642ED|nr:hypothetical protein [Clostridium sp. 'deep sea']QOR35124.1 hypothetical protein IMX26_16960 [Clostridium sp. 'deep sea']
MLLVVLLITLCAFSSENQKDKSKLSDVKEFKQEKHEEVKIIDINGVPHFNLNRNTNYEKITDYCSHKIDEIPLTSLAMIKQNYSRIYDVNNENIELIKIIEVEDGYLLAFKQKQDIKGFKDRKFHKPYIKKIDFTGKELWHLTLTNVSEHLTIDLFKQLPNGNIIISFTGYEPVTLFMSSQKVQNKNNLTCISQQGEVLWKQSFIETCDSVIKHILVTEKDELLCVGVCDTLNPPKSGQDYHKDIVLSKIDNKGAIIKQRIFGGSNFDNVRSVDYSKQFGLLIEGMTESTNGDFKNRESSNMQKFIARLDSNLNSIWCKLSNNKNYYGEDILINDKYVYITKHIRENASSDRIGIIEKYNKNGDILSSVEINLQQKHLLNETLLPNGDFIITCSSGDMCELRIYNQLGIIKKSFSLKHSPRDIIVTTDGGFILKSTRNIKTLPQPLVISCIWYDTETTIEKYNNKYELEWRKSYDNYQDELGTDFVLPLPSGKVIVQ